MANLKFVRRAILSVSDKTHLVDLAQALRVHHIELISTGGTARLLQAHHIAVTEVSELTGFPEIMDGRVKTLHPLIHAGILSRRDQDKLVMQQYSIQPIDLVIVNLYPFQNTINNPQCTLPDAIKDIDIGGPTMIRAAGKNYQFVAVIVDPNDYQNILAELNAQNGALTETTRFYLAQKAFGHTAQYDAAISNYLNHHNEKQYSSIFPKKLNIDLIKRQDLRYGENPHQRAAFYAQPQSIPGSIITSTQLQGKPLSFNNINDADTALECAKHLGKSEEYACVIVKHANPCGAALAQTQIEAYQKAYITDPQSAFGGIIAFNQALTKETANIIINQQFAEIIIAPDIDQETLKILSQKPGLRVLNCGKWQPDSPRHRYHTVTGGLLVQDEDIAILDTNALQIVTKRNPTEDELKDLLFAWKLVKFVKSNAIVYAKNQATVGIGAGQTSRIISAKIAKLKATDARLDIQNSVAASDAFFPFRDAIDVVARAGITAIIQPGGSIRDKETIQAANEANIAMIFTGIRHFRH